MFEIAFPLVFLLWPLPLLIRWILPRVPLELPVALRIPFFNGMMTRLETTNLVADKRANIIGLYVIWTLLLLALSGPRWVGEPRPLPREGYNIMLALDLSGSMEIDDMMLHGRPATRLAVVKRAATQFVDDRKGDKIGLILFGSQAYLQTPLTYDHHSLLMRIDDATVGLAGKTTSIGDALGLAVKRLQQVPAKGRLIILLTDGANNSGVLTPMKAAELAAMDDIKIYTIGLGAEDASTVNGNLFLGLNAGADLDEDTLKKVAQMTGGQYFRATDSQSLHEIYRTINQMEVVTQAQELIRPQHEYYAWPLGLACLLYGFWLNHHLGIFRRKPTFMVERDDVD